MTVSVGRRAWVLLCAGLAALQVNCGRREPSSEPAPAPLFVERAREAGLSFTHSNGMSGRLLEAEIYSPGVALFDYDNDGDLDAYFVQGGPLDARTAANTGDRLFRNDLPADGGDQAIPHFTDVTAESGIHLTSYGVGVTAGDFNNDGWTDLYATRLGANALLRNNHDGTFTDVAQAAGVDERDRWSVSATFADLDNDGWLDLYVGNYLSYRPEADVDCFSQSGAPDYCDPGAYPPGRDRLFVNKRNGTFQDVTERALQGGPHGAALGVITADFDRDGWTDVYVANDRRENDLWMNQHDGTFRNTALIAGVALNGSGKAEGSMGVDAADFDRDGDDDLIVANFAGEGMTLYANHGDGTFEDRGTAAGLRAPTLPYTGFGVRWLDVDNDGWLDVVIANGAVQRIESRLRGGDMLALAEEKQLFRNLSGRYEPLAIVPDASSRLSVGRGLATGDVDNDGDIDVVIANNNGAAELLLNQGDRRPHWIGLRALGPNGADALGARILVETAGIIHTGRIHADGSYASSSDPRVLLGLGASTQLSSASIVWPDGRMQELRDLRVDRWNTIREEPRK